MSGTMADAEAERRLAERERNVPEANTKHRGGASANSSVSFRLPRPASERSSAPFGGAAFDDNAFGDAADVGEDPGIVIGRSPRTDLATWERHRPYSSSVAVRFSESRRIAAVHSAPRRRGA